MAGTLPHFLTIAIVAMSIALMLLRPRGIAEVWWVGPGAIVLIALGLIPLRSAVHAVGKGLDVYLFLIGMMLLSVLAQENGVFDWVANAAVRSAGGSCARLFALVYLFGTFVTICMSNDATAVVLTPAVLTAIRKSKVSPLPYLFACAMIANAASFVLPISNPANLVVFHTGMPPLGKWLASYAFPSLLSISVTFLVLRWYFRKQLRETIESPVSNGKLATNGKIVLAGLCAVIVVLLVASARNMDLGLPTCLAALVTTAVVAWIERSNPLPWMREISWSTLLLVAALFIMVAAVEQLGALHYTQAALVWAQSATPPVAALVVGMTVGIANNLVNNLPLGLIAGATVQAQHLHGLLANVVLIGVDLGPNLSVTGSLATILWLIAMRKENMHVTATDFLKVGVLAMPAAMLAAIGGLLIAEQFFRLS
jgi:arsenical pump membrane protein